jgi:hypothetical protein
MRKGLGLALVALLCACGREKPKPPYAVASDPSNHGFALDLPNGRVQFIQGAYPRKSYYCWATLDGRKEDCHRLKGYALEKVERVLEDGAAVLEAKNLADGGGRVYLRVEPRGGKVLETIAPPQLTPPAERWPEETAALGPNWRYSVVPDPKVQALPRQAWLRPRLLWKSPVLGAGAREELVWTQRQGQILAVDEDTGRMYFAVTDRDAPALWILPLNLKGLAAAVPLLDGLPPVLGAARLGIVMLAALIIGMGASMAGWYFIRRR